MGCGTSFVKYVLFFFNLLYALFGLVMIGLGVALRLNWVVVTDELREKIEFGPWLFIVIGAIVFVIAFFGCCGAIRESHCMVVTYAIFLLILIIIQVVLAVLLFVYAKELEPALENGMTSLFNKAKNDKASSVTFEAIETQLGCCGNKGPQDYGITAQLPASCCSRGHGVVENLTGLCTYADAMSGCWPRFIELYQKSSKIIGGVAIAVACMEVVGALFALCLANSIRNMDRRSRY